MKGWDEREAAVMYDKTFSVKELIERMTQWFIGPEKA